MEEKITLLNEIIKKLFPVDINNYIFVYTPPKVGSTSLVSSLRISLGKSYNVIHIHDDVMLNVLTGISNVTINEIISDLAIKGKNVYVIDIYRTPIERKISEFFEKISPYHFNNTEENINKYSLKRVIDRFNKLFPHLANGEHYFDKFPIDHKTIPNFDFNKKYTHQVINNINFIKLRLCDSNCWGKILSEIFSLEIISISDYQTENKNIGEIYKKFKNEYKIPDNFIELITNCKYFNFYNSEEERKKYLDLWSKKIGKSVVPYTSDEYKFYVNLYLENQYINDIQTEHYIDNGCFCDLCCKKRRNIFLRAKGGEKNFEKIIHDNVINEERENRNKFLIEKISNMKKKEKYGPQKFLIKIGK